MVLVKMGNELAKKIKPFVENSAVNDPKYRPDIQEFNDGAKIKRHKTRQDVKKNKKFKIVHANTISGGKYWRDPVKLKL